MRLCVGFVFAVNTLTNPYVRLTTDSKIVLLTHPGWILVEEKAFH